MLLDLFHRSCLRTKELKQIATENDLNFITLPSCDIASDFLILFLLSFLQHDLPLGVYTHYEFLCPSNGFLQFFMLMT